MPKKHRARWIALATLVVGGGLVAVLATRPPVGAIEAGSPLLGKPAPPITGTDLAGQPFDLSAVLGEGKWAVVTFFASWCPPCQQELPELVAFSYEHRSDVQVVGVVYDDSPSAAAHFLSAGGASWPAMGDQSGSIAYAYGVTGPAEAFVIAPNGTVGAHILSAVTQAGLDRVLSELGGP